VTNPRSISRDQLANPHLHRPNPFRGVYSRTRFRFSRGGVTAVNMELAEPGVRTVWEHTTFRVNPIRRLRRTRLATMVTVYVYAEPPLEINKGNFPFASIPGSLRNETAKN
jgi:ER-bound oxygenase mpaB/B'/Rubber oxygenase, catalytic domain